MYDWLEMVISSDKKVQCKVGNFMDNAGKRSLEAKFLSMRVDLVNAY